MSAAARLDDPIEHTGSLTGLLAGFAIGAIGAALIVGTGGLAAVAMVGAAAATGAGIGQLIGSMSICSHQTGQIISGSGNVDINGKAAARAHVDKARCDDHGSGPNVLAQGSSTVYINGYPAARVDDRTECDAKISSGSANVFIGGETETTDAINPEVPILLERGILLIGLASAFVLASPVIVIAGFVAGITGGTVGNWAGGKLFGEGSDGQKLMAFGGALLGGGLGAKGGKWFDARYEIKAQGFGSNLGNVKITRRPMLATANSKGVTPEIYQKLRSRTPSKEIQAMVNKDVVLPMKDPALPSLDITKPLHADHIVPMKQITEMDGFNKLTFNNQLDVLNHKPNFSPLSETANTSRGAKTYEQWTSYKKGNIDVDPTFRNSMIDRSRKLEIELQEKIYSFLP
ncbi:MULTISPECIES: PAAR domain-containing protein [Pseudomonas syringae group]|uniref:Rhs protein n=1 Tax=Pseudomonas syringae pv. primulae TaxID=251707 RepID=A0A3M3XY64_9PSED|nr:PAAR domain-containing protein [Pseudomonas syringae group genomosp. 3]RMO74343.1 Rhs protein [Pseudomonas syringae pv. primulae]RMU35539.1 Rhs protein [Pseudomonas syringae pv. primulae]